MVVGIVVHCRKVCKHCLHTRDDHDIKDEENLRSVTVGKILFAPDVTVSGSPASSPALPRAKYVCAVYLYLTVLCGWVGGGETHGACALHTCTSRALSYIN